VSKVKLGCAKQHGEREKYRQHRCALRCYLSGFTRKGDKNSHLYVFDSTAERAFVRTPQSIVAKRKPDQNETKEGDRCSTYPDPAQFESELIAAVTRLDRRGDFSDDADRGLILRLIAQSAVFYGDCGEVLHRARQRHVRRLRELAIADRQGWESQKKKAAAAGIEGAESLTYEELSSFLERDGETIAAHTIGHLARDLRSVNTVYNLLQRRSWMVGKAAHDSGGFITSDRPVTLSWDDKEMEDGFYAPGFGLRGTTIFFPLTKGLVLRGRLGARVGTVELPVASVAAINSRTVFHAGRQIYAETEAFRFLDEHLAVRHGEEFLPTLRRPR
jgi:hypothetical protein